MSILKYFEKELGDLDTDYFLLDTKGGGAHGDIDFVQYQWSRSRYDQVKEGDLFIYRRPGKSSETGQFYLFGACKIGRINGKDRVTALLEKTYPFQNDIHKKELQEFQWTWKRRGETWEHFFNQYGMNKINKNDFVSLVKLSELSDIDVEYDGEGATEAVQSIQKGNYYVSDHESRRKVRSKQGVFSNKVKTNYNNKCAVCLISTKEFLVGSHIVPWSKRADIRLDPSNGICLCFFHDRAFDKGFITINDDYAIRISRAAKKDTVLAELLLTYEQQVIHLPKKFKPNIQYLQYHRENVFIVC